eukprot:COSAG06_NODE_60448_length_271_cov_0.395349_1_plen_37_part_10
MGKALLKKSDAFLARFSPVFRRSVEFCEGRCLRNAFF